MNYAQIRVFERARSAPEWVRNLITMSDVLAAIEGVVSGTLHLDDVQAELERYARERRGS